MAGMMCVVAGLMVSWSAPNGSISRKYTFLQRFLLVEEATGNLRPLRKTNDPARGGRFGVTLVPLWGHFGYMVVTLCHFGITVGSLWSHFGYMKVHFQKTHISPTDFNDLSLIHI